MVSSGQQWKQHFLTLLSSIKSVFSNSNTTGSKQVHAHTNFIPNNLLSVQSVPRQWKTGHTCFDVLITLYACPGPICLPNCNQTL
eukprot:2190153-Ditylum_brightwellii.AAC.1